MKRAIGILAICVSAPALAHTRSESYSHWHINESSVTAVVTIGTREVTRLTSDADRDPSPAATFAAHLGGSTEVFSGNEPCPAAPPQPLASAPEFVRIEIGFRCAPPHVPDRLRYRAMFSVAPSHVHYAKLYRGGVLAAETLITDTQTDWVLPIPGQSTQPGFPAFLRLGAEHIAGGYDHLAFVLGLLLVAGTFRHCAVAVTGFTLGHSISLAAATLGYVSADARLVEAFIGYTVALIALEYFLAGRHNPRVLAVLATLTSLAAGAAAFALATIDGRQLVAYAGIGLFAAAYLLAAAVLESRNWRLLFVATSAFGLVHGFGFAGFLMQTGLPGDALLVPLAGFNIGVELGQLAVVGAALVLAHLLADRSPPALPQLLAASLCGVGLWWFLDRTLSP